MTQKDIHIQYLKEHGKYPVCDNTYIEWLEEYLIRCGQALADIDKLIKAENHEL